MRPFGLLFFIVLFITSAFLNCSLYDSIARIPYFGITITEYAEKERDVFLLMYIAGGSLLPHNEKIKKISMSLARRTHKKAFIAPQETEPIGPYATRKTFDLAAALIHILYWVPPVSLALFSLFSSCPKLLEKKNNLTLFSSTLFSIWPQNRKICLNKTTYPVSIGPAADQKTLIMAPLYFKKIFGLPGAVI